MIQKIRITMKDSRPLIRVKAENNKIAISIMRSFMSEYGKSRILYFNATSNKGVINTNLEPANIHNINPTCFKDFSTAFKFLQKNKADLESCWFLTPSVIKDDRFQLWRHEMTVTENAVAFDSKIKRTNGISESLAFLRKDILGKFKKLAFSENHISFGGILRNASAETLMQKSENYRTKTTVSYVYPEDVLVGLIPSKDLLHEAERSLMDPNNNVTSLEFGSPSIIGRISKLAVERDSSNRYGYFVDLYTDNASRRLNGELKKRIKPVLESK